MVLIYERSNEGFVLAAKIEGSPDDSDDFGYAIALGTDSSLVVGAPFSPKNSGKGIGDRNEE